MPLQRAPTGDQTHNPGICSDWESNLQPFALWYDTQPAEPHWSGKFFLINVILYLDQEVYDFIDPNTEDVAVSEQGDTHVGSFVSFLKVKKTLNKY